MLLFGYYFLLLLIVGVNVNVNAESIFHYNPKELNNYKLFNGFDFDTVEIMYNKMQCNSWKDMTMYENITKLIPEENRIFFVYLMINDINKQIVLYIDNEFLNVKDKIKYTKRNRYECNTTLLHEDDCFYYDFVPEFNMLKYSITDQINKLYFIYSRYDLVLLSNEYESNILQLYSVYLRYKYNIYTNTLYSFYSKNDNLGTVGNEKIEKEIKNSIIYRYRVVNEYRNENQNEYQTKLGILYNINLVNNVYKLCNKHDLYCFNSTDKITPLKVNCGLVKLI